MAEINKGLGHPRKGTVMAAEYASRLDLGPVVGDVMGCPFVGMVPVDVNEIKGSIGQQFKGCIRITLDVCESFCKGFQGSHGDAFPLVHGIGRDVTVPVVIALKRVYACEV